MKIISPVLLGLSLAVAGSTLTVAQDASQHRLLPKILQFTIEYTKPYKAAPRTTRRRAPLSLRNKRPSFLSTTSP